MNYGFIYCLANEYMPGVYKIGMTDRAPSVRCAELSNATSAPVPFDLLCFGEVNNALSVEREIHDVLSSGRVSQSREFFQVDYREIKELFLSYTDHFCETARGHECSHALELMQSFYIAETAEKKVEAVMQAAQFAGIRLWREEGRIRTSRNFHLHGWVASAISGLRDHILPILPPKMPVSNLMAVVRSLETSE
jgi:hypothetical protein